MKFRRSELVLLLQALAIILPVAALSGIALHFLHEDRTAIEEEARKRAREDINRFAMYLNQRVIYVMSGGATASIFQGQPLAPGDYPQQPEPGSGDPAAIIALRQLEGAEAAGAPDLVAQAVAVAQRFPTALTDSGTPVSGLALLLALRYTKSGDVPRDLLAELQNNVIFHPSFLTPAVVGAAVKAAGQTGVSLEGDWGKGEAIRETWRGRLRTVAAGLVGWSGPAAIRLIDTDGAWLALCQPVPGGWKVNLGTELNLFVDPPYAALSVEIDQEHWRFGHDGPSKLVLASTNGTLDFPGGHHFRITEDLADPELLYAPYRKRLKLTSWVIFSAAGTALIGLASLWIGYRRQARLSEMKSNFVSSVSHELRAPLAAVRLMAESLESGRVTEDVRRRDYYRLIVQECRRLSGLVENVLDLSRIGDGRKNYRFEPVDLMALVRQTVALMEPNATERQVTLRINEPTAGEWQPDWDGQAVEQSLVNLLDNAIKHSPAGAEVRVAVEREADKICVWVEDRGPGIPPREQKRIFELFYRHGSELRRETKGAGIGLSIVRHVAEAHGGRVIVDSEVGRGSRFGLELPVEHRS